MTEHSFDGIHFVPEKGKKCNPCVRYDLLPLCRLAHPQSVIYRMRFTSSLLAQLCRIPGDFERLADWPPCNHSR
jgi:hypothetical protein